MQATVDISRAQKIYGWMTEGELLWLGLQAVENNHIVEFGSFHGRSTRALADNCQGRVWAVDPWSGHYPTDSGEQMEGINTYCYPEFVANLSDLIASHRVVPYRGYSYNFHLPYSVDMVFIDGDHRYEAVLRDIDKALELLRTGGLICGHDYNWPTVEKAVNEKLGGNIEVCETIWWTRKYL